MQQVCQLVRVRVTPATIVSPKSSPCRAGMPRSCLLLTSITAKVAIMLVAKAVDSRLDGLHEILPITTLMSAAACLNVCYYVVV